MVCAINKVPAIVLRILSASLLMHTRIARLTGTCVKSFRDTQPLAGCANGPDELH